MNRDLLIGGLSGIVSRTSTAPLELMKMQQQQTNKYNIRLKNLESSIRELKIKDTQRTELVHKLQEKLKNHDITLTKLSTKTVTGRKMMDTNNVGLFKVLKSFY